MWAQTCLRVYREIVLSLSEGVHQPGAVSICGIVGVPGRDLDYGRACEREEATKVTSRATLLSTVVKAAGGFISLMWYSKSAYWIPSTYICGIRGIMHFSAVDPPAQLFLQHSSFWTFTWRNMAFALESLVLRQMKWSPLESGNIGRNFVGTRWNGGKVNNDARQEWGQQKAEDYSSAHLVRNPKCQTGFF